MADDQSKDDELAGTEQPFVQHLMELRDRMIRALLALAIFFVCLMPWAGDIYDILANDAVTWSEVAYASVKGRPDIMQFFGDKYGDSVRVVQVGGKAASLNGWSMELCAGTHVRHTGEIGLFRIVGENAIAAGVRRIEAVAGLASYERAKSEAELLKALASSTNTPIADLAKRLEQIMEQSSALEKKLKVYRDKESSQLADTLVLRGGLLLVLDHGDPALPALRLGANHPMGPLELADFMGLDVVLAIMNVLYDGLADSKYRPCPLLVKYVEAGWLGRKSGRGFYDYSGETPAPTR